MADQQYCLRWNNHQTTLVSIFDTLLQRNRFTDCTISAENQSLAAHKILLTACSPYFETVLSQIRDDKHPVIVLKDVTFAELKALMDYMYRGEVNISQDQLAALLKVAESLQIKGLSDSGEKEKPEKRPAPLPPPPTHTIPLVPRSSGLTIEHSRRSNQAQVLDLPLDSPLNRQDGSISPGPRKRKRTRRRSSGDETSLGQALPLTESLDSNSRDTSTTSIPLNVASLLSKTAVIPEPNLNDHVLPDSALVDLPKAEPLSEHDLIQPKEEYVDDHEDSVENITLDDDDMDDMDVSQAGPSHGGEGSSSQGYPPSWHQASDRSNDEVFMAAQEAVGGQRDSQDVADPLFIKISSFVSVQAATGRFQCLSCDKTYTRKPELMTHIKYECGKVLRCPKCNKQFKQYANLTCHVNHECGKVLQCPSCNKRFSVLRNLTSHIRHECGKELRCPTCNKQFKYQTNLCTHVKHECGQLLVCTVCYKRFSYKSDLGRHIKFECGKDLECLKMSCKVHDV